jgi:diaminopimelate decarboxylase
MVNQGYGLEAATFEEVKLAVRAGCPAEKIVFDSPVKRPYEIQYCAEHLPGMLLNANSIQELKRLAPYHPKIRIGLRINPLTDVRAPSVYDVSQKDSKFGVPLSDRDAILKALRTYPVTALHVHAGSSMKNTEGAEEAIARVVRLADEVNQSLLEDFTARRITYIDIGGGLYPEKPEHLSEESAMNRYVAAIRQSVPQLWSDYHMITEFGQWTHYYTGYAYTDVEYVTHKQATQMAYIHLGADFLLRDVYIQPRQIEWIALRRGLMLRGPVLETDIAGPLCFASDFPARNILLPALREGDGLLLCGTGSNAYALWSRHTSRTIPAMYGVDYMNKNIQLLSDRFNPFLDIH